MERLDRQAGPVGSVEGVRFFGVLANSGQSAFGHNGAYWPGGIRSILCLVRDALLRADAPFGEEALQRFIFLPILRH